MKHERMIRVMFARDVLRACTAVLGAGLMASTLVAFPYAAAAQGERPLPGAQQPSDSQLRYQAPIGHRQPRPQDLPPNVTRDEGKATSGERALDQKLEICVKC